MPGAAVMKPVAFGKLPAHGDFVSRGLSPAQTDVWDTWFAGAIEAVRTRHGEAFRDAHAYAPAWRFLLGEGKLGGGWRAGAIAPSVDSVGREFFLMAGYEEIDPDGGALLGAECAELALREAIVGGQKIDDLIGRLAEAAPRHAALAEWRPRESASLMWTLGGTMGNAIAGDGAVKLAAADLSGLAAIMFGEAGA